MNAKKIIIGGWLIMVCASVLGQTPYQWVLETLDNNSPAYKALKAKSDAEKAAVGANTFLENPEIEFGYYWGDPSNIGKRWDLSIEQSFDLPPVYVHKKRIRELMLQKSESDYAQRRIELLGEALSVCTDMVYYNAYVTLYEHCVSSAEQVADIYKKKMDAGDCSILEYNRAQMNLAAIANKLHSAETERDMMLDNLQMLNGGKYIEFTQDTFSDIALPDDFGTWFRNVAQRNPNLRLLEQEMAMGQEQEKLAKAEWLPQLALGYASENVVGETFRGLTVTARLPLWHQKGTVRKAKQQSNYAKAEYDNTYARHYNMLKGLYRKAKTLKQNLRNLQETYAKYNSEELLYKALDAGEITLESYLQQVEFYHDSEIEILEIEHELEHTVLSLESYGL